MTTSAALSDFRLATAPSTLTCELDPAESVGVARSTTPLVTSSNTNLDNGLSPTTFTIEQYKLTLATTIADSSILPVAQPGLEITVINAGAASMNVFPDVGSQINNAGVNTAFALAAGKTAIFFTTIAGAWHSILSA